MASRTHGKNETWHHIMPSTISFSVYSKKEVAKLSVKKINTSLTFDSLNHPLEGGLYDVALGPFDDKSDPCGTCFKNIHNCPGHFGHIELPVIVVNPLFHSTIAIIFKLSCMSCGMLQIRNSVKQAFCIQMKLLDAGFLIEAQELASLVSNLVDEDEDEANEVGENLDAIDLNHRIFKKYTKLLKKHGSSTVSSKNIEAIRCSFIRRITKSIKVHKKCLICKDAMVKMSTAHNKIIVIEPNKGEKVDGEIKKSEPRMVMPDEMKEKLQIIWDNEKDILLELLPILQTLHGDHPTDVMFMDTVLVLPPIVRPVNYLGTVMSEHPKTSLYKSIIDTNLLIRTSIQASKATITELTNESQVVFKQMPGNSAIEKFHIAWQDLQAHVDHLMNKEVPRTNKSNCDGLKQVIEKKTGIIRQHMMGKRVNFAARSVITPDPNLNIDEIGVPETFAKRLTYPVMVTPWNVTDLRKMVLNGPDVHPGAAMVEEEDGTIKLIPNNLKVRKTISKQLLLPEDQRRQGKFKGVKIVHRHLITGDMLVMNRQPTLHKAGIMAHTARILKNEKTLRLHYANCKAYNADFDGDEMNAHYPQNELARSEAYNILNVSNQYLVPKDGTPLSGLIQDHMIAGVRLSIRGKFFTKDDYHQLVYTALAHKVGHIALLPPAIRKPACLWSGKQIISTVVINSIPQGKPHVNLSSTAKIGAKAWEIRKPRRWKAGGTPFLSSDCMSEAQVIFRQGELICGVLDKTHYGATPYGLIHCIHELHGGKYSSKILSAFSKMFTAFLQREGFTLGVHDILVVAKADEDRRKFVEESRLIGTKAAADAVGLSENVDTATLNAKIEESYATNPKFQMIIDRHYKTALDSYTNNINKVCIPSGLVSKFPNNNLQLMVESGAKGSKVNCMQISCLLGQIELEGKRPPVMISGRTLPSFPPYDTSPRAGGFIDGRFMTGIQPQEFFFHCMAGREGLIDTAVKTSRSGYLQRCLVKHLEGLTVGYDLTVRDCDNSVVQFFYGEDGMDIGKVQYLNPKQLPFLADNMDGIVTPQMEKLLDGNQDELIAKYTKSIRHWKKKYGRQDNHIRISQNRKIHCPDPVATKYQPDHYPGVLNERLQDLMNDYLKSRSKSQDDFDVKRFRDMFKVKAMNSLCAPGEPVGMLAAQSIGEPSTQMTLNTFHFAGRGEMNVTLGIPRLREILMLASKNIKTPSMEVPFRSNVPQNVIDKFCIKLNRVTVANVLEKINIKTHLDLVERKNSYTARFHFLPPNLYKSDYHIRPGGILKYMEKKFFENMFIALKKAAGVNCNILTAAETKNKQTAKSTDEEDDEIDLMQGQDQSQSSSESEDDEESKLKHAREDLEPDKDDEQSDDENPDDESKNKSTENIHSDDDGETDKPVYEKPENITSDSDKVEAIRSNVVNVLKFVKNYRFDVKNKLWCELVFALPLSFKQVDLTAILKDVAQKSIIWQTPQIRRAITYYNNDRLMLRTDGINITEMFKHVDILDIQKLYSNDIHAIAETYGIEAATRVIVKEIRDVFNVYGITVNPRHLLLMADYMTYDGVFSPLSRKGMEAGASPLQQMSFESSLVFLKNAVMNGKVDQLKSPSSCLMVGYPCYAGTGSFSLLHSVV